MIATPVCIMFPLILKGFIFTGGWKFTRKVYIFEIYVLRRIKWALFCIKTRSKNCFYVEKTNFFTHAYSIFLLFELMKSHALWVINHYWQWEIWNFMGLELKKWNICKEVTLLLKQTLVLIGLLSLSSRSFSILWNSVLSNIVRLSWISSSAVSSENFFNFSSDIHLLGDQDCWFGQHVSRMSCTTPTG